jgi:predicted nucleotidyltransferase component of viral defense system
MDEVASILAKLQNKARETGRSFQLCLQLFCQEEFLRKVALSKYADNLILKGGLFIYTLTNFESRATVDIDFLLRNIPNSQQGVSRMINEIIMQETGNDFIQFQMMGISNITLQRKYNGISAKLMAMIKNTRTPLNIDMGIGDIIIPKPEKRIIPTQLNGFANPEVNTYSVESTIAEKFDIMLQRLEFTSRMKDYYDIYYLVNTFNFEGRKLQEAIFETLQKRGTTYEKDSLQNIVSFAYNEAMNVKWQHFLKKLKLSEPEFVTVIKLLEAFLTPIYSAITNEDEFFGNWNGEKRQWEGRIHFT